MYAGVLAQFIGTLCRCLGRPAPMKMKCPQRIGRESWVRENTWSVLRHSPEAGRSLLRGGQRAGGGTDRTRLQILVVVVVVVVDLSLLLGSVVKKEIGLWISECFENMFRFLLLLLLLLISPIAVGLGGLNITKH